MWQLAERHGQAELADVRKQLTSTERVDGRVHDEAAALIKSATQRTAAAERRCEQRREREEELMRQVILGAVCMLLSRG